MLPHGQTLKIEVEIRQTEKGRYYMIPLMYLDQANSQRPKVDQGFLVAVGKEEWEITAQ